MGRGIDGRLAGGTGETHPGFQRLDHLHALDRSGFRRSFRPKVHGLISHRRAFRQAVGFGAKALVVFVDERFVLRRLQALEIRIGHDDAVVLLGRGENLLVADAERGGRHRDFVLHARRDPLPVERIVGRADQHRHDDVGLRRLDLADGRPEIADVEREEITRDHRAAVFGGEFLDPFRGDLAVIVVGCQRVDLLAV